MTRDSRTFTPRHSSLGRRLSLMVFSGSSPITTTSPSWKSVSEDADAHYCIMVRGLIDPPNTSMRRNDPRRTANSPRNVQLPGSVCPQAAAAGAAGRIVRTLGLAGGGSGPAADCCDGLAASGAVRARHRRRRIRVRPADGRGRAKLQTEPRYSAERHGIGCAERRDWPHREHVAGAGVDHDPHWPSARAHRAHHIGQAVRAGGVLGMKPIDRTIPVASDGASDSPENIGRAGSADTGPKVSPSSHASKHALSFTASLPEKSLRRPPIRG